MISRPLATGWGGGTVTGLPDHHSRQGPGIFWTCRLCDVSIRLDSKQSIYIHRNNDIVMLHMHSWPFLVTLQYFQLQYSLHHLYNNQYHFGNNLKHHPQCYWHHCHCLGDLKHKLWLTTGRFASGDCNDYDLFLCFSCFVLCLLCSPASIPPWIFMSHQLLVNIPQTICALVFQTTVAPPSTDSTTQLTLSFPYYSVIPVTKHDHSVSEGSTRALVALYMSFLNEVTFIKNFEVASWQPPCCIWLWGWIWGQMADFVSSPCCYGLGNGWEPILHCTLWLLVVRYAHVVYGQSPLQLGQDSHWSKQIPHSPWLTCHPKSCRLRKQEAN